jgi:hypothetical protein
MQIDYPNDNIIRESVINQAGTGILPTIDFVGSKTPITNTVDHNGSNIT